MGKGCLKSMTKCHNRSTRHHKLVKKVVPRDVLGREYHKLANKYHNQVTGCHHMLKGLDLGMEGHKVASMHHNRAMRCRKLVKRLGLATGCHKLATGCHMKKDCFGKYLHHDEPTKCIKFV